MNIHLRPLEKKDAPLMLEWQQDPSIMCFFRFDTSHASLATCEAFIAGADRDPSCRHYAIADEDDTYLGTISLKHIDPLGGCAEYAICTRQCAHGTGAALQATQALLRIAFEELELQRVYLNSLEENGRANAFYRKAGFRFVRSEERGVFMRGEWKTLFWFDYYR